MDYKIKKWIVKSRQLTRIRTGLKNVNFKDGSINLYEILVVFFKKLKDDEVLDRANGVAFSFTIALFPAILFLFTLVPYINIFIPGVDNASIMEFVSQWVPENMYSVIESTIGDILSQSRGGLLTFGAVFALVLASNGTMTLMNAFNAIYKTKENRSWLKQRAIATALTIMLALAMVTAVVLLIAGQVLLGMIDNLVIDIDNLPFDINQVLILRFVVLLMIFGISISALYYFAPAVHFRWKFFSVGAIFATFFTMGISYVFSFYVANFATYNKLYGSIGVMIALMIWLFLISVVLLVGYLLNSSIHQVQYLHKIQSIKAETSLPKLATGKAKYP